MRDFVKTAAEWLGADGVSGGGAVSRALLDLIRDMDYIRMDLGNRARKYLSVLEYLDGATDALDVAGPTGAFKRVSLSLPWTTAPLGKLTGHMDGRYTFASIVGPNELIHSDQIRFGAFLVAPNTFYPSHWHAAEEIYMILSGTAQWNIADGEFLDRRAGEIFRHESWQKHATRTGPQPMLALWAWHGDIRPDQYGIEDDSTDNVAVDSDLFSVSLNNSPRLQTE